MKYAMIYALTAISLVQGMENQKTEVVDVKETVVNFLTGALTVAELDPSEVKDSLGFTLMKNAHNQLKSTSENEKLLAKHISDLDGYVSDDEKYFTEKLENCEETHKRIKRYEGMLPRIYAHVNATQREYEQQTQRLEILNQMISAYCKERAVLKNNLKNIETDKEILEKKQIIVENNLKQQKAFLVSRKNRVTEEIAALEKRIASNREKIDSILDKENVSESMMIKELQDTEENTEDLDKELESLKAELKKITAKLSKRWFSWN